MHNYYGGGYPMSMGNSILDFAWHVLLLIVVVWIIVMIVRSFSGPRHWGGMGRKRMFDMWQSHSALSILNERFAKGEIDQKEYEERKKVLMKQE